MPYDQTTINSQLDDIQTAITAALVNPRPDWQVGQVRMGQSAYLKMLFEQQDKLIKQLKEFPAESIDTYGNRITPLGHDGNEYHNEDI